MWSFFKNHCFIFYSEFMVDLGGKAQGLGKIGWTRCFQICYFSGGNGRDKMESHTWLSKCPGTQGWGSTTSYKPRVSKCTYSKGSAHVVCIVLKCWWFKSQSRSQPNVWQGLICLIVVHLYRGILFSTKKEGTIDECRNLQGNLLELCWFKRAHF